jgi:hypothetical protein
VGPPLLDDCTSRIRLVKRPRKRSEGCGRLSS